MSSLLHLGSDEPTSAWVHRIVRRAMVATKAIGADLTAQSAMAVEAVHEVHPYLSTEEMLAAVYSEDWSCPNSSC